MPSQAQLSCTHAWISGHELGDPEPCKACMGKEELEVRLHCERCGVPRMDLDAYKAARAKNGLPP